jgi:hypothetical protein
MEHICTLSKMRVSAGSPIQYYLDSEQGEIHLNSLLGNKLGIEFMQEIHCLNCGKKTRKSFGQGYCYPCFISIPETSDCVLRPELCQAHLGVSRDMNWSQEHCLQEHIVYLALTSAVKVGVTRISQVPTRWIDQGAWKATPLARTPNRYLAGMLEVELKQHLTDKTNWRHMLTNQMAFEQDLLAEKHRIKSLLSPNWKESVTTDNELVQFNYPVLEYPKKINSFTLDKQPVIEAMLTGIRGQYLIFETGFVINIRSHGGYRVIVSF